VSELTVAEATENIYASLRADNAEIAGTRGAETGGVRSNQVGAEQPLGP